MNDAAAKAFVKHVHERAFERLQQREGVQSLADYIDAFDTVFEEEVSEALKPDCVHFYTPAPMATAVFCGRCGKEIT